VSGRDAKNRRGARAAQPAPAPSGAALLLRLAGVGEADGRLAKLLGAIEVGAMSPELAQLILLGAIRYRTAGGVWTPEAFAALPATLQMLVYEAGEKYGAAQALTFGHAAQGGRAEALVAAEIDGGIAYEEHVYREALDRAHAKTLAIARGLGLSGRERTATPAAPRA